MQTTVLELLPVADTKGIGVSLMCSQSLVTRGNGDRFYKAIFYLIDFLLSFAGKGDELSLQAHPQDSEIAFDLHLCRHGRSSVASKSRSKAKTYLAFLIARQVFEVEGGRVDFEHQEGPLAVRIRLPLLLAEAPTSLLDNMNVRM